MRVLCTLLCLLFLAMGHAQAPQSPLSPTDFLTPPQRYGIRCWWWWLNGNVTKAAISRDLAEMKARTQAAFQSVGVGST